MYTYMYMSIYKYVHTYVRTHICSPRARQLKVRHLVCTPSELPEKDLHSTQMRPTFMPKETHMCSLKVLTLVCTPSGEPEQSLHVHQMRPTFVPKETCIHVIRGLYV